MSAPRIGGIGRLPHFIIIGAMKSATSTLQEQLSAQPGIFMSTPKEPNFFSDDAQYGKGIAWYSGLFDAAREEDLLGEASTHYTKLPTYQACVARMVGHMPAPRLVYVMRHPVDRLVSHYIHEWSMGNMHVGIEEAVARHPELVSYGCYSMQLEPYLAAYGHAAILPVFFDRMTRDPQGELERVCKFIGYGGRPRWIGDLAPSNVSSQRVRRFPLHGLLVQSALATRLRRALVPKAVRNRIRANLTMRERPELPESSRKSLESLFDRDLVRLGDWLGTSLSCANFSQVTAEGELNWVER